MAMNRIRALRKGAGYNQKELGNALGVGQTTVSAWEIGRNEPDNDSCNKMAKLFGCSIGYLMGYEAESEHRGLSDAEWYAYTKRIHDEYEEKKFRRQILQGTDTEEEDIREWAEAQNLDEWEKDGRSVFPETVQIDKILERTDEDGRRRALQVIELMFP